jgi:hypothetical protein
MKRGIYFGRGLKAEPPSSVQLISCFFGIFVLYLFLTKYFHLEEPNIMLGPGTSRGMGKIERPYTSAPHSYSLHGALTDRRAS